VVHVSTLSVDIWSPILTCLPAETTLVAVHVRRISVRFYSVRVVKSSLWTVVLSNKSLFPSPIFFLFAPVKIRGCCGCYWDGQEMPTTFGIDFDISLNISSSPLSCRKLDKRTRAKDQNGKSVTIHLAQSEPHTSIYLCFRITRFGNDSDMHSH
jgi:hypothetical protein